MHFTFPKALQSSTTTSDRHSWRPALVSFGINFNVD